MQAQPTNPDTVEVLRKLAEDSNLRPQERAAIEKELQEIDGFARKLTNGHIEIAAFGEVSAGKSSLLNALIGTETFEASAAHGTTVEVLKAGWRVKGFNSEVILVDTPGINEAGGELRAQIAQDTVRYTDLVLFVTDSDLNKVEIDALRQLHGLHKPLLLVINKKDLYSGEQIRQISASIVAKVGDMVGNDDIVFAAAAPREIEREIHRSDGSVEVMKVRPKPDIEQVEVRMLSILEREGKAIVALNANLFASDVGNKINKLKHDVRGKEVARLINTFMVAKAIVVAANPVVLLDILGGMASDALMIRRIGAVYGTDFSLRNAELLIAEIIKAWGITATGEYVLSLAAGAFKSLTFGAGTVLTAVPQGLIAAWGTYVVGNAANIYFRDGGWSGRSAKDIVHEIIAGTDRDSVLAPITEKLKAKFGRN